MAAGAKENRERRDRAVLFAEVPPELHRAARIQAIEENRPVNKLVEEAVRRYLDELPETEAVMA